MFFAGLEVHIRKPRVLGLEYGPGPQAESHTKERLRVQDVQMGKSHSLWSHSDCRSNLKYTCDLDVHGHVILVSIYLVLTAVIWSSHRCSIYVHVCQDYMPRLTYFLEYGCHAVHHHRGRKVHTLAIHMASHFDHEKRMHGFLFLCMHVVLYLWLYGALLDGPLGCQSYPYYPPFLWRKVPKVLKNWLQLLYNKNLLVRTFIFWNLAR